MGRAGLAGRGGVIPHNSESSCLDLERFAATPLASEPFDHVIVPEFVRRDARGAVEAAFPGLGKGGSFPVPAHGCDPLFTGFVEELRSPRVRRAFAAKFGIDLAARPAMVTLRGRSRAKDGRIHADSKSKLLTALIYVNPDWRAAGGRLRLLRGAGDLDDFAAEVPPDRGTLIAFRCVPHAYHGHMPYVGVRRSVQLNWMTDQAAYRRETTRHGLTAWAKGLFRLAPAE